MKNIAIDKYTKSWIWDS